MPSNKYTAENRARVLAKLQVDELVEANANGTPRRSFVDLAREYDEYIKSLPADEFKNWKDNATTAEKKKAAEDIINALRDEKRAEERKQVDKDGEKYIRKTDTTPTVRPDLSQKQKGIEVDNLKRFYNREKKQEQKKREEREAIDRDAVAAVGIPSNVFDYIKLYRPPNDIHSYRKVLNRYSAINSTRGYIEDTRRNSGREPEIGSFYSFRYWAKGYDTLPKFDRSPLIYCLDNSEVHFLGINFHWCNSNSEAFDIVADIENGNQPNYRDELFHTYLKHPNHLLSPLWQIDPDEIRTAILLPLVAWYLK
jgi:hypothetical protein